WSPDGKRLLTAGGDRSLRIWDAESGRELFCLRGHSGRVSSAAFSPDGRRIVSSASYGYWSGVFRMAAREMKLWDAETGREILTLPWGDKPRFTADGQAIVFVAADGTIKM